MKISDILEYINVISPLSLAESYDNVGLLVGSGENEVTGIATCLDITNKIVDEAIAKEANLIVSHHPVIFHGLKSVPAESPVYRMIANGIGAICIHTNFDITEGGVNDTLLELLGFASCGVVEPIHPNGLGFGAICDLELGFTPKALAEHCKQVLYAEDVRYCGSSELEIKRVAVVSGSGGSLLGLAREKGCQALITGDIKHDVWIEAHNTGMALIDAGHFGTEKCASHRIAALLSRSFPSVPVFACESEKYPFKCV